MFGKLNTALQGINTPLPLAALLQDVSAHDLDGTDQVATVLVSPLGADLHAPD